MRCSGHLSIFGLLAMNWQGVCQERCLKAPANQMSGTQFGVTARFLANNAACRVAKQEAARAMQAAELAVPLSTTKVIRHGRIDSQKASI